MNKRLENYLWSRFADMLPDRSLVTPQNSCMYWGFSVGDGWYNLVKQTLILAEQLCKAYPDSGAGFRLTQVKEKFGCLRIYWDGWITPKGVEWRNDPMMKIFTDAEFKSATICMVCGKPGDLNKGPWIQALCPEHNSTYAERNKRSEKKTVKALKKKQRA